MYDVVIIGAGISGLVCGCYLAKAGMKVLIVEQHNKPGGYCTSFKRQGFTFDAAAHCFGGYKKGYLGTVFRDLGIDKKITIQKSDPSNLIIMPNIEVLLWDDIDETIKGFQELFPAESSSIKDFFYFLINPDPMSFVQTKSWTFKDLLDQYFNDKRLKTILAAPLLGIGGLPPSLMSAFVGAKLFSDFLLDGGYHPKAGMQALPDALSERFKEFGGELRVSCMAKKITVQNNHASGVVLEKNGLVSAKYIVSNCDTKQTFLKFIDKNIIKKSFSNKLQSMIPSISNFIIYLGLDSHFDSLPKPGTTLCFFSHYDLDKAYQAALKGDMHNYGGYMLYVNTDSPTILAIMPSSYKNRKYWETNKSNLLESFINIIEKSTIPNLSKHIIFKEAATPNTLYRYTMNYRGASFGWGVTPSQLATPDFKKPSFIQNLYLTGQWTTLGIGISGVVYVGYDTAKLILRKNK